MSGRERILVLILVMVAVASGATGASFYILYRAAFQGQRQRLVEKAHSQARLMESVARFNARYSVTDVPEGALGATLSQIRKAHARFEGFGRTGEFSLARREGDRIVFVLSHRHQNLENPTPVPFQSVLAEPMRRALSGESGTVIGLDYRGKRVLAAYEPVEELDLGVVAKIDLTEIREPFVRAGLWMAVIALVLTTGGTAAFFRIGNPMVERLRTRTEELQKEVTERKRAEEELKKHRQHLEDMVAQRTAELEASQERLLQAQKMEAIGRLVGGIAHDFNNIMTVVTGYAGRTLRRLDAAHPLRRNVEGIKDAGEHAMALVRQLLAFGRKQILQPKVLDLNSVVSDSASILGRTLGEDIDLVTILQPDAGRVKADPVRIEQVIMNLAVNARHAMPKGGRLTVETANVDLGEDHPRDGRGVPPGPYVMLSVRDTGCGMDEETKSRIFEPFFTTKEPGEGTGLGLSTVYGTVRQSGGVIRVYSEPDGGTTFKIYLPRVEELAEPEEAKLASDEVAGGTETILLVEDDPTVRELTALELQDLGYTVLHAQNGQEAGLISRHHAGPIHLLLTDVVLPGMSGRETMEALASQRPEIKALYMSGHTEKHIVHRGILDPGIAFLEKPFTPEALARKVREVLDAQHETHQRRSGGEKG